MGKSCAKCGRSMEEGFLLDAADYSVPTVAAWHRGKPVKSWFGLKVAKADKLPVTSWRCTACGYLENYAG